MKLLFFARSNHFIHWSVQLPFYVASSWPASCQAGTPPSTIQASRSPNTRSIATPKAELVSIVQTTAIFLSAGTVSIFSTRMGSGTSIMGRAFRYYLALPTPSATETQLIPLQEADLHGEAYQSAQTVTQLASTREPQRSPFPASPAV
jgi:hypothetical protein